VIIMASFEFDPSTVPAQSFDVLPAGWYTASVTGCEVKATKSGTGEYIRLEYTVSGPTAAGRKVFANYNTKNENAKAEEIGRQQLAELCRATGVARLSDTDQLIGASCQIKVTVRPAREQYDESNEVKSHKAIDGSAPPAAAGPAVKKAAAPPWAKK
jgi:hypothetical protein